VEERGARLVIARSVVPQVLRAVGLLVAWIAWVLILGQAYRSGQTLGTGPVGDVLALLVPGLWVLPRVADAVASVRDKLIVDLAADTVSHGPRVLGTARSLVGAEVHTTAHCLSELDDEPNLILRFSDGRECVVTQGGDPAELADAQSMLSGFLERGLWKSARPTAQSEVGA
jgi:hypothetical protein